MSRRLAVSFAVLGIVGTAVAPALAAPKPMSGKYEAQALVPDPTPITGATGGNCRPTIAQAKHEKAIDLPGAGTFKVDLNGFQGDWALAVLNSKGQVLADDDNDLGTPIDSPQKVQIKVKSKGKYTIRACNFAGGPTAQVAWKYTPTK